LTDSVVLAIAAGLVSGIVLIFIFSINSTYLTSGLTIDSPIPTHLKHEICPSLTVAMFETPLQIKQPSWLPDGYGLKCANGDRFNYSLLYWNQSIISIVDLQNGRIASKGGITIMVSLDSPDNDPAYYIKNRTAEIESIYKELKPTFQTRLTSIEGHLAVVREQSLGLTPTMILFYDGDLLYSVWGYHPSTVLERIANSIS
jgi:hypothetical protein